ncbi:VOC family protein [Maliponia aquimaris]|uniref:Manganese-dependent 2,3-dihydroxybiphenyl 1,2-dioxygenase n=1 Tax=Maliponia aquimaris TaxID=1673631 RepID=A0A238KR02_9RHOB|nr:VOC family protein [Maliponia aquimaris]SMX45051.1 Manganese-dependent 2,3-dihydroxybiphenyl 1,2-dioxygenase [Maliponia aquimaris]
MSRPTDPSLDIAHLAHVEMLTDRCDESLDSFTRVYGLKLSCQDESSACLRAWDEYEVHALKLTRAATTGIGHVGYRVDSPEALERRVAAIEASGCRSYGRVEDDMGHGRAYRFEFPFGHLFEIGWDTMRYLPAAADAPALKNNASHYHARGVAPRRIDRVTLLGEDVSASRAFVEAAPDNRVKECIQFDNVRPGGVWFTCNNKTCPVPSNAGATDAGAGLGAGLLDRGGPREGAGLGG